MWYRVFGQSADLLEADPLLDFLATQGKPLTGEFQSDELGWFEAELHLGDVVLHLNRYLVSEEGLRQQLNTWAAWIELHADTRLAPELMQQLIRTTQLYTFRLEDVHGTLPLLGPALCQWLAQQTDGLSQIDGQGFFTAAGRLVLTETAS